MMMALTLSLSSITPLQKKLISGALIGGAGFWGGIKFCDVKIKAQIGQYEIKIEKLNKQVEARDVTISEHISEKEKKINEALIAKKEADVAKIQAGAAEDRYRKLVAQIPTEKSALAPLPVIASNPTPIEVANACDEVLTAKNTQIKGLETGLSACFDSKAAADKAIEELKLNETDLKSSNSLQKDISNGLRKQLESQNRRKWLYFAGGIILTKVVDNNLKKK